MKIIILFALLLTACAVTYSQGFRGLVPLSSTCEDVKRILKVENCKYPNSRYEFPDGEVSIYFVKKEPAKFDKLCWKISPDKVESIFFQPRQDIPLTEFEPKLEFIELASDDSHIAKTYGNKERGIEAYVIFDLILQILYKPTLTEFQKFSYPCSSPDAGDGINFSGVLQFDRYWNLSLKKEKIKLKEMLPTLIEETKPRSSGKIYIVYYYKNRKDIKLGLEKAKRAKQYFEKGGIKPDRISIYNGGLVEGSPIIAIYLADEITDPLRK